MVGHELQHRMVATPVQLTAARHVFARWLTGQGVVGPEGDDWELVFAELAANAVQSSPAHTEVAIRASCVDGRITLRVTNVDNGTQVPRVPTVVRPSSGRGRGLQIVSKLVDGLVFETDDNGVTATCWKQSEACPAGAH